MPLRKVTSFFSLVSDGWGEQRIANAVEETGTCTTCSLSTSRMHALGSRCLDRYATLAPMEQSFSNSQLEWKILVIEVSRLYLVAGDKTASLTVPSSHVFIYDGLLFGSCS